MFYDTYAFFEIISKNPAYTAYLKHQIVTTRFNLLELHYGIMRLFGKEVADTYYDTYLPYTREITDQDLKDASAFRLKMKLKKMSYIDCIGYVIAQKLHIPFLTGDKAFEDMPGVEFVK